MLSRRVLNRTLVYQINREEAPPGNNQKCLLEGKPTVQLNRTLGFPEKGTTKKLCDKDFAERSGELSGAICLKTLVLLGIITGSPLELFRKFFGAVRAIFWLCGSFLAPDHLASAYRRLSAASA